MSVERDPGELNRKRREMPYAWQMKIDELSVLASEPGRVGIPWEFVRNELIPSVDLALEKKEKLQQDFKTDYTRKVLWFLEASTQMVLRLNGSADDEDEINKHRAYLGYLTNGAIPEDDAMITAEILSFESFVAMKKPKRMVVGDHTTGLRPI